MNEIIYKDECYLIQGAIFEVYQEMGPGFLEAVYQECLEIELRRNTVPFASQKEIHLIYKGDKLLQTYKPDIICYEKIIVEIKAATELSNEHKAQLFNYLKATGMKLGLLVNFGHYTKVQIKRMIL